MAFSFDSEALCERRIELGHEIRFTVLDQVGGKLGFLPCSGSFLTAEKPIRASKDNLARCTFGCGAYNFYDVRVDPDGEAYFLEFCLYRPFEPRRVIVGMCCGKGT